MMHPAVIALVLTSVLISLLLIYAGWYGYHILRKWDLRSGSDFQLRLERRTYLISAILGSVLVFQILSLFLFIFTADALHSRFVGAMCAAGSLNVNPYGYPVLLLKIVNCLLAGVWLIVNRADNRGYDYPLIKAKYALLMLLVPLVLMETVALFGYFGGLQANVITSCCGSLFSLDKRNIAGDLAALPAAPMAVLFFGAMVLTMVSGAWFRLKDRGGYLFSAASFVAFIMAAASLVSFICLYFYELPTHHCPFCLLQQEYGHVGYVLYATLLGGGTAGLGVGALMPFRNRSSLVRIIPSIQRRLVLVAMVLYLLFTLIVAGKMLSTPFRLMVGGLP
ncbi:hypothetical protein [Geobacter sp. SVR]|uniref:hypothetical protein n=1 Tax=Geobacter sp. SVR TaxID=2495594 RepID=UPI00143EFC87|nr:hypothetical protein [Geobacter sp. SVR]BCS55328.1 hypothetical protein GSVR_36360 [Geobacter sp. SVR]GCF87253.1 hypothetical protein GSbR_38530 [Geobacter sp. SVR]